MKSLLRNFFFSLLLFSLSGFFVLVCLMWTSQLNAKPKIQGELGFETRAFAPDNKEQTRDIGLGLSARFEFRNKTKHSKQKFRLMGRIDYADTRRSALFIEEAWIEFKKRKFSVRIGSQLLNWTATEAFHPADLLNSRYLDGNIENPEKMGEPMLSFNYKLGDGSISLFYMPMFIQPKIADGLSRFNFMGSGLKLGEPIFLKWNGELSEDRFEHQWGLRVSQKIGQADLALHFVQHIDRSQPSFVAENSGELRPLYHPVTQIGMTYMHALGSFLLKLEAAHRIFDEPEQATRFGLLPKEDHTQLALGLEYSKSHQNGMESTLLLEFQSIFGADKAQRAQLSLFQRDVLIGYRLAFNDTVSREILATAIFDLERGFEVLWSFKYSQRLSDSVKLEAGLRGIYAPSSDVQAVGLERLHKANYLFADLTWYF